MIDNLNDRTPSANRLPRAFFAEKRRFLAFVGGVKEYFNISQNKFIPNV